VRSWTAKETGEGYCIVIVKSLGIVEYSCAFALQEQIAEEMKQGCSPETLLLLEHDPVYTIGRGGCGDNVLDRTIQAIRISRGGDVTYHGPGQLVGYPLLNLRKRGGDLRHYLRFLEEVLISGVADFGVKAFRVAGKTGVWTDQGKLAAIGVGVRHWITMHGFAMNVNNDLSAFSFINPCGMAACPIASLEKLCGRHIAMEEVKSRIAGRFEQLLMDWLPENDP
jgi:lipoyl(octanoyl) transferase